MTFTDNFQEWQLFLFKGIRCLGSGELVYEKRSKPFKMHMVR